MLFPDAEFLQEEVRCDHLVTERIKKLWYAQLDCYKQLKRICEKYNIRYFASGGTLLGCARHQGYIPWDDDMDIAMFPEDYMKFCEVAAKELSEPYFFQNYKTEKDYNPKMSRIRRSDTTFSTEFEYKRFGDSYNLGIFIDIFPISYIPPQRTKQIIQQLEVKLFKYILKGHDYYVGLINSKRWKINQQVRIKSRCLIILWKCINRFVSFDEISERFLKACFSCKKSTQIGMLSFFGYSKKTICPAAYYSNVVEMKFEDTSIPCPKAYDDVLTLQYGNWHKMVKGTALHTIALYDPDTPYSIIMEKEKEKLKKV